MKNKFSGSQISLASIKGSPVVNEINELAKKLHLTRELKKAYEITKTKEEVLEALKVVDSAKQGLTDQVKELCGNLDDNSICATYVFAKKISKGILKFLSPYLLKNIDDINDILKYIPEKYIKESNQKKAMNLLAQTQVSDYLQEISSELAATKSPKLEVKSPSSSTTSTSTLFNYEEDEEASYEDNKVHIAGGTLALEQS